MRRLLSILSATCLLLGLSLVHAKAACYTIPPTPARNGCTVGGDLCVDQNSVSFTGAITKAGQTYDIVAVANVTGQAPRLTVSGSITVSQGGQVIKQVTINQTTGSEWAAIQAFLEKVLGTLPQ